MTRSSVCGGPKKYKNKAGIISDGPVYTLVWGHKSVALSIH